MIEPIKNWIFIRADIVEAHSKGGIVLASDPKPKRDRGTVAYIGNECERVKVGDYVLTKPLALDSVEIEGEQLLAGTEDDVIAIITK